MSTCVPIKARDARCGARETGAAEAHDTHPSKGRAMAIRRLVGLNTVDSADFMARRDQMD
jgi:hypothetical protein